MSSMDNNGPHRIYVYLDDYHLSSKLLVIKNTPTTELLPNNTPNHQQKSPPRLDRVLQGEGNEEE